MRNERINMALADVEVGASSWGSGDTLESVWPQAGTSSEEDFALALERDGSETAVLFLAGELDLYRTPAIEDALAEAIEPKFGSDRVRHLTVDLRLVTFIDSATLLLLFGASQRQQEEQGHLLVLVGPQTPMTAFEVVGFDRLLAIRRADDEPRNSVVRTVNSERIRLSPPLHTTNGRNHMTTMEATERARASAPPNVSGRTSDETKLSLKTTEFWAMGGIIAAILVASAVSDSLGDVRAWTLVAAVGIGYMISRGLAKAGTKYTGGEDSLDDR